MDAYRPTEPFVPAPGLGTAHVQTIIGHLLRRPRLPPLRRERFDTPDGDFVDVDFLDAAPGRPWLLLLHGLEGSSESGYIGEVVREAHQRGWGAAALNFRSCSGEENRLPRSYHSGETGDARFVLERLKQRHPGRWGGVGFSLGGNVLLRLLAETGPECPLDAAVAVSVPFDLASCARALDASRGLTALYRVRFLRTLRQKALAKARRHPGAIDAGRTARARGIADFDDAFTAPLHGFPSAAAYYASCSSGPVLHQIARPTLLVSAKDDPMVPGPLPTIREGQVQALFTDHGGHVGFLAGSPLRPRFWAEAQAISFLSTFLE